MRHMPPTARAAWSRTLGQLGLVLAAALAIGLLLGQPGLALALAALAVLAWHYWRLRRLLARLPGVARVHSNMSIRTVKSLGGLPL